MVQNQQQSFSAVEIFNHIYFDEPAREFSADSIKSLVKRLRKKLPENLIKNTQQLGYSINLF
jgi:DNA-binding response OmpR family regulator